MAKFFDRRTRILMWSIIALIVCVVASSFALSGTLAKYLHSERADSEIKAPDFYFESNLLTVAGDQVYQLTYGTKEISFSLKNFADEFRYCEMDISYTVSVEGGGTLNTASGTLTGGNKTSHTITLSGLEDGKTYTITATGNAGFEQTLSAKFSVRAEKNNVYKYVDDSHPNYVLLTVWSQHRTGDALITFPKGLIPDNTDPILKDVKNLQDGEYQSGSFTDSQSFVTSYSSRTYRFFKTGNTDYSEADFTVTGIGGDPAIPSTP